MAFRKKSVNNQRHNLIHAIDDAILNSQIIEEWVVFFFKYSTDKIPWHPTASNFKMKQYCVICSIRMFHLRLTTLYL